VSRARWRTRLLGPVLLAATLVSGPSAAAAAPAGPLLSRSHAAPRVTPETADATPLTVTLTSMTPGEIPRRGAIRLVGVVTNASDEDWTDINVAPFVSGTPLTTRSELAEAATTSADVAVGERLTDSGAYATITQLAPGESVPFSLRVPVAALGLGNSPGVYWIGVHALGANSDGRDLVADGRARTFIPLVPPGIARGREVPVSVVLPLRERARRAADGSLNGPTRWTLLTRADGRLSRLVDFGASAGSAPVSWLVDPAVLDALDDFSRGNPPLTLGTAATAADPDGEAGGADPATAPSTDSSPTASRRGKSRIPTEEQRIRAKSVLETFVTTARDHTLLTLGYADPDIASLARRRASLIERADALSARQMKLWGLTGTPAVAPPSGYFDPELLTEVPMSSLMMLEDHGRLTDPPLSRLPTGQELVLTDTRTAEGGPAPGPPRDALALRQRILSEAALEAVKGDDPVRPIVVRLPVGWDPGANWRQADFFAGLRTDWLRMAPVPRDPTSMYIGELPYGRAQLAQEIGTRNVTATRTLVHTSGVLGKLLVNQNPMTDKLVGAALEASSYSARPTLELAADQVLALDDTTHELLDRVKVTGTDFVTLSSGSGSLTVTLVNGLKQPITVGLQARADSPEVKVETPKPVAMQPGERTTLRLQVSSRVGVHEVTLSPVTTTGEEAGEPLTFSLRTSNVGELIWYIIIAGGTLLAVMIVRRIVLRIRNHRWREGQPE
jgi:hypothetical protein